MPAGHALPVPFVCERCGRGFDTAHGGICRQCGRTVCSKCFGKDNGGRNRDGVLCAVCENTPRPERNPTDQ